MAHPPPSGKGRGAGNGVNDPSWLCEGTSRKIPKRQGLESFEVVTTPRVTEAPVLATLPDLTDLTVCASPFAVLLCPFLPFSV